MPNRLAAETSPYLLQHAANPVDWYPWSEEALSRARSEDRPILLSIGYSACHWCHVMAHESFENAGIASLMNDLFVNIKVDREERPDLDAIYMQAVQAISGSGGWPMTMFLTPDGIPFYGGTYFPPEDRGGRPGFPRVLLGVSEAYRNRRDDVLRSGRDLLESLRRNEELRPDGAELNVGTLEQAFAALAAQFDERFGGFGGAPKFPQPMALDFLFRYFYRTKDVRARQIAETTLARMAEGGIYDHLGGGFHRYSTDARWLIPHFEKMLYDNAQLARVYLNAFQISSNPVYLRITEETLDYVLREMTAPEGGFFSTQDADSEGEEGKFFAWTAEQVVDLLGQEQGNLFCGYFGVTSAGNFEGKNVLHVAASFEQVAHANGTTPELVLRALEEGRPKLLARRAERIRPGLDDKVLTAWNGLMLRALSEAGRALGRADYLAAAVRNAEFASAHLTDGAGLIRTWRDGRGKGSGYLEDYAYLINGLLSLYEATFDVRWFSWARDLATRMIDLFADPDGGGFFDTGREHESLVLRPKDLFDNAVPSGNSAACEALLRLSAFTGDDELERYGLSAAKVVAPALARFPTGFGHMLCALEFALGSPREVAIVGKPELEATQVLLRAVFRPYLPAKVVAGAAPGDRDAGLVPLLQGRIDDAPDAIVYVCQKFACQAPTSDPEELARQLGVTAIE